MRFGVFTCFVFLCLWCRGCFFLLKVLRLDLVLFALLEAEHSISQEKGCHLGSFFSFCNGGGGKTSRVKQMSECETRCEVHCGGFIGVVK